MLGFLLSGCHYHFGQGVLSEKYETVSVPYIEGDGKGDLTAEVIKRLEKSGAFHYASSGGDLLLKVTVKGDDDDDVGFRYVRKKDGAIRKVIVPTETRRKVKAEVILQEGATGMIVHGPTEVVASIDFDHDFYYTRHEANIFSLGQLNDYDVAEDLVQRPLNKRLAQKIVDEITHCW